MSVQPRIQDVGELTHNATYTLLFQFFWTLFVRRMGIIMKEREYAGKEKIPCIRCLDKQTSERIHHTVIFYSTGCSYCGHQLFHTHLFQRITK